MTTPFQWPNKCTGAVSLSFDDGRLSHLKTAIPLLNERDLLGTFYLCPGRETVVEHLEAWRQVHTDGHEIGNHSVRHTCSEALWGRPSPRKLETLTLADVESDITEACKRLGDLFPERTDWTFAYPCYQTEVGVGAKRQSYVPVIARHFLAARAGTPNYGFFNAPGFVDLHALASQPCEQMRAAELVGLAERAARRGHWAILTFHEIDRGGLGVFKPDFIELLDHLAANRDRIWTAPVAEIARCLKDAGATY
ncbi:MAG: polysaccharide deacetylase family protein [Kiritimatiellaeota bacterium]|nr:polysaccharide deacetylase family protein [Kiritimatiellota bacterium]